MNPSGSVSLSLAIPSSNCLFENAQNPYLLNSSLNASFAESLTRTYSLPSNLIAAVPKATISLSAPFAGRSIGVPCRLPARKGTPFLFLEFFQALVDRGLAPAFPTA